MKRIMLRVAYDGTAYHGWQIQNNGNTIEGEINKAIKQGPTAPACGLTLMEYRFT